MNQSNRANPAVLFCIQRVTQLIPWRPDSAIAQSYRRGAIPEHGLLSLLDPTRKTDAQSKMFIGGEAIEKTFKALAPTYATIQLATHGVVDNRQPLYSHLPLTKTEGDSGNDELLEAREINVPITPLIRAYPAVCGFGLLKIERVPATKNAHD